jgi:hypothetical protein
MKATIHKTMQHTSTNIVLRCRFSHKLVLLKGTASAVPQHTLLARGALAPEVNLAEAHHGW